MMDKDLHLLKYPSHIHVSQLCFHVSEHKSLPSSVLHVEEEAEYGLRPGRSHHLSRFSNSFYVNFWGGNVIWWETL